MYRKEGKGELSFFSVRRMRNILCAIRNLTFERVCIPTREQQQKQEEELLRLNVCDRNNSVGGLIIYEMHAYLNKR
jgi:hypothetical protein